MLNLNELFFIQNLAMPLNFDTCFSGKKIPI
jgi:hypothetical protein